MAKIYTKDILLNAADIQNLNNMYNQRAQAADENRRQWANMWGSIAGSLGDVGKAAVEAKAQSDRLASVDDKNFKYANDPSWIAAKEEYARTGNANILNTTRQLFEAKEAAEAQKEANRLTKKQQSAELQKQKDFKIKSAKNAIAAANADLKNPDVLGEARSRAEEKKANAIAELEMYGETYTEDLPTEQTQEQPEIVSGDEMFDKELSKQLYETKLAGFVTDLSKRVTPFGKQFITAEEKANWIERANRIQNPEKREEILNTIRGIPTEEEAKTYWAAEDAEDARLARLEEKKEEKQYQKGKARKKQEEREEERKSETKEQKTINAAISNNTPPSQLDKDTLAKVQKTHRWNRTTNSWEAK